MVFFQLAASKHALITITVRCVLLQIVGIKARRFSQRLYDVDLESGKGHSSDQDTCLLWEWWKRNWRPGWQSSIKEIEDLTPAPAQIKTMEFRRTRDIVGRWQMPASLLVHCRKGLSSLSLHSWLLYCITIWCSALTFLTKHLFAPLFKNIFPNVSSFILGHLSWPGIYSWPKCVQVFFLSLEVNNRQQISPD